MAIVYTKLFCLLEERGISLYRLKKMTGLADGTITSMRNNTSVTTDTLYVPTDFDTKEKALSGAKAAEKGLK